MGNGAGSAIMALVLAAGIGGTAWWLYTRPRPSTGCGTKTCPAGQKLNTVCTCVPDIGGGGNGGTPTTTGLDKFGIKQLYASVGHDWFSKWDNGHARSFQGGPEKCPSPARIADPDDSGSWLQCNPGSALGQFVRIDGKGVAEMEGKNLRYYIMDGKKWLNVEMTGYYYNVKPFSGTTNVALRLAVRTNHWNYLACASSGTEYAYEEKMNGTIQIRRESGHPYYNENVISSISGVPKQKWVGMKIVCRNTPEGWVLIQCYRDMTDGLNGGDWKLVVQIIDKGNWPMAPADIAGWNKLQSGTGICKKIASPYAILKDPADACLIRCDGQTMRFKKMSAREIAPLASSSSYTAMLYTPFVRA